MAVRFEDLLTAFEIADTRGSGIENVVYLCRQTGKIHWQTDYDSGEEEDELPDDIEDETKYIQVPDKRDLDLGQRLIFDFVREVLPDDYDDVRDFFRKKGGYRKFRALVERRRVLDRWYAFENDAKDKALRDWCEVNDIKLIE
jgi:hypothetical protein